MFLNIALGRWLAIGGAAAFAVGVYAGWTVCDWKYSASQNALLLTQERYRSAALEDNLRLIREALIQDGKSAEIDLQKIEELDRHAAEIAKAAANKPALSAATVDRLREFFERSR